MTRTLRQWLGGMMMIVAFATMAVAQNPPAGAQTLAPRAQEDPLYTIFPPSGWERVAFTDGAKIDRVEFINGDRRNGLLKIKRIRLEPGETIESLVAKDTDGTHRFLPSYVAGKSERFAGGAMSGYLVQFDFSRGGAAMMGRNYYLAGKESTVWVLQFTGERTSLAPIRNDTDQVGRTFREN